MVPDHPFNGGGTSPGRITLFMGGPMMGRVDPFNGGGTSIRKGRGDEGGGPSPLGVVPSDGWGTLSGGTERQALSVPSDSPLWVW